MKMKEKLIKNHYKGFDHRMKIVGIASFGVLVSSALVFLPLTAQVQTQSLQQQNANNKQDIGDKVEPKELIELYYQD